jgi:hypothetical protein
VTEAVSDIRQARPSTTSTIRRYKQSCGLNQISFSETRTTDYPIQYGAVGVQYMIQWLPTSSYTVMADYRACVGMEASLADRRTRKELPPGANRANNHPGMTCGYTLGGLTVLLHLTTRWRARLRYTRHLDCLQLV